MRCQWEILILSAALGSGSEKFGFHPCNIPLSPVWSLYHIWKWHYHTLSIFDPCPCPLSAPEETVWSYWWRWNLGWRRWAQNWGATYVKVTESFESLLEANLKLVVSLEESSQQLLPDLKLYVGKGDEIIWNHTFQLGKLKWIDQISWLFHL